MSFTAPCFPPQRISTRSRWGPAVCTMVVALCAQVAVAALPAAKPAPPVVQTPAAKQKPAVGVFGRMAWPIIEHLRKQGFPCTYLYYGSEQSESTLRQFNVIVLAENGEVDPNTKSNHPVGVTAEYDAEMRRLLADYVEKGGGLLLYGGRDSAKPAATNALMAPWGAQLLNEAIIDPAHHFRHPTGQNLEYNYTEAIAKHPATEEVQRIFYPLQSLYGQGTQPLQLDKNWAVLLTGSPEASSHPLKKQQAWDAGDPEKAGAFSTLPPIAAARGAGKGRIVVFAWNPLQTFFNYGHFMVGDIYFSRGGGEGKTSDGMKLLEQTLSWLGEPSLPAMSGYGGYVNAPYREQAKISEPIDWSRANIGGPAAERTTVYKGIIGARTALTGGQGTVADYVKAAGEAGLQFVGFVEDFTQMTQQQWDAFREECRKATTPDVLAIPGYAYPRGTARDIYFKVGDFVWPQADMCSPDGKAVMNAEFDMFDPREACQGPFDIGNLKSPFWRANAFNSFAVATTKDGNTEWNLDEYLDLVQRRDDPRPVAVDLVTSPAGVQPAAKRLLNCMYAKDQSELLSAFKKPDRHSYWFQISSGPLITHVQADNAWRWAYGKSIPGTERVMVRVMGTSEQPLKELEIYDGTRLFRRFDLSGNEFDITFNAVHDHTHDWVYVLKDAAGGTAVRSGSRTADFFHYRFMCGDRQNSLAGSFDLDKDGNMVNIAAAFSQPKSILRGCGFPANPQIIGRVAWYWDGATGGLDNGVCNPMTSLPLPVSQEPGTNPGIFGRMEFLLSSAHMICQAASWNHAFPDMDLAYQSHVELVPLDNYQASVRFFEVKKTPGSATAMLIEGYYRMLTDGDFVPGTDWIGKKMSHSFYSLGGVVNESTNWAIVDPASGEDNVQPFPAKSQAVNGYFPISPGGFFAISDAEDSAAMFPLDRPMLLAAGLHAENWCRTTLGYDEPMGRSFKKGEIFPFRVIVYSGAHDAKDPMAQIRQFRQSFGLNGDPAYKVTARQGKVLSTVYMLDIEGKDGGFAGTLTKADLQERLPVRVHGVNPNWTCGIVDKTGQWWLPTGVIVDMPELQGAGPAGKPTYATYAALELNENRDIYVGNVVASSNPELILVLVPDGLGGFSIEAHNPTGSKVTAEVSTVPEFTLGRIKVNAEIPAGSTVMITPDGVTEMATSL